MDCSVCDKYLPEYGCVVLTMDGDMACSKKCEEEYKKERDHFLNVTIHDDKLFEEWLGVPLCQ